LWGHGSRGPPRIGAKPLGEPISSAGNVNPNLVAHSTDGSPFGSRR
jgi:hypothetical protein